MEVASASAIRHAAGRYPRLRKSMGTCNCSPVLRALHAHLQTEAWRVLERGIEHG
jgi:hypothetical protein